MTKEREIEIKNILAETERKVRDGEIRCFSLEEFCEWIIQRRQQRVECYYNAKKNFFMSAIASEDYRKYIIENGIVLSDWDMATLIYHNMHLCIDERIKALQLLAKETAEEKLKIQISECISCIENFLREFRENDGNAYYQLRIWYEGEYRLYDIYLDYESAYLAGLSEGECYRIDKDMFAGKVKKSDRTDVLGMIEYNPDGSHGKRVWLYEVGDDKYNTVGGEEFCSRGINLPLCFKRGDIVKVMGTNTYGIVEAPDDSAEEEKMRKFAKEGDYSDFQVPVKIIYDGKRYMPAFAHHVSPAQLEYAKFPEDDMRKGFFEYMAQTMLCTSFYSETGRDKGRIPEVLSKIEKAWKQYPDLRLGQLLLNVCGAKDLFVMEDEELMKCLEENTFGKGTT